MAGAKPIPLNDADVAEIEDLIERWREAWLSRDWSAVVAMCTDDIAILSPGEATVTAATLRPYLETYPEFKAIEWINDYSEGAGNLAVLRGHGRLALVQDDGVVEVTGRFCDVLRKDEDGKWLVACINWMPDAS